MVNNFEDKLKIIVSALLVMLLVVACGSSPQSNALPTTTTTSAGPTPTFTDQLAANARHVRGNPDAPVTIIEFSDFK